MKKKPLIVVLFFDYLSWGISLFVGSIVQKNRLLVFTILCRIIEQKKRIAPEIFLHLGTFKAVNYETK